MKHILLACVALSMGMSAMAAEADTLSMKEVVVTGTRTSADVRHLSSTVSVIDRATLEAEHQPSLLPTLSRLVPSMFVTSRGMMGYGVSGGAAGGITLRGLSGGTGQMLVLIDGHPQYNGIYNHPIADAYRLLNAERVEVLRGPASVLYGSNAMGGVVNIVTRQMKQDGVKTNVTVGAGSYGTVEAQATNRFRKNGFFGGVGAEYNRTDNHRDNMGFEEFGGNLRLGYDINEHWLTRADAEVTHFNASQPGSLASPLENADQWITRGNASLRVENHYNRFDGAISVFSNFGQHKIDDGNAPGAAPQTRYFRSRDNLSGVSVYETGRLFKGNTTTLGLDYQHIYGRAYYTDKVTGDEVPSGKAAAKKHRNEVGAYVDFRQDVVSWLTLDFGLRLDHHSITGTEWVPQGGIVVRPIEDGEIKAVVSKGFRNPSMREQYLYAPANPDLNPERLINYELAWNHRILNDALTYGVNIYYIDADNLIQTQPKAGGGMINANTGKVQNLGFEVTADYRINSRWAVNTNHGYVHMKNPVLATPTYKGLLGARFHEGRWSAQASLQYIADLYKQVGATEDKTNFCLFSASVNFNVWRGLSLWTRGETLIGEREYEIIQGYPMPHATIMAGISWDF